MAKARGHARLRDFQCLEFEVARLYIEIGIEIKVKVTTKKFEQEVSAKHKTKAHAMEYITTLWR